MCTASVCWRATAGRLANARSEGMSVSMREATMHHGFVLHPSTGVVGPDAQGTYSTVPVAWWMGQHVAPLMQNHDSMAFLPKQ